DLAARDRAPELPRRDLRPAPAETRTRRVTIAGGFPSPQEPSIRTGTGFASRRAPRRANTRSRSFAPSVGENVSDTSMSERLAFARTFPLEEQSWIDVPSGSPRNDRRSQSGAEAARFPTQPGNWTPILMSRIRGMTPY